MTKSSFDALDLALRRAVATTRAGRTELPDLALPRFGQHGEVYFVDKTMPQGAAEYYTLMM